MKMLKMLDFTKSFKIAGWHLRAGRIGRNYPVTFWKDPRNESKAQRKLLSWECLLFFALELWFFSCLQSTEKRRQSSWVSLGGDHNKTYFPTTLDPLNCHTLRCGRSILLFKRIKGKLSNVYKKEATVKMTFYTWKTMK